MNRGQLVFEVSRSLGLDDTAGSDELTLMQRWANRAVVDVLAKTHCYVDIGDLTLTSGVSDYRTDSSVLALLNAHITDNNQVSQLEVINMQDLDAYLNSNIVGGAPCYMAIEGTFMRVAPTPTAADVLRYYYVPRPTEMTADGTTGSDTNDPSVATYGGIPVEYHDALVMYMLWQGAQYDDKGGGFYRGHAFAPGSAYQQVYESRIKEIRASFRKKAGRGLHPGRVGYPNRGLSGRRNDTYPSYPR